MDICEYYEICLMVLFESIFGWIIVLNFLFVDSFVVLMLIKYLFVEIIFFFVIIVMWFGLMYSKNWFCWFIFLYGISFSLFKKWNELLSCWVVFNGFVFWMIIVLVVLKIGFSLLMWIIMIGVLVSGLYSWLLELISFLIWSVWLFKFVCMLICFLYWMFFVLIFLIFFLEKNYNVGKLVIINN